MYLLSDQEINTLSKLTDQEIKTRRILNGYFTKAHSQYCIEITPTNIAKSLLNDRYAKGYGSYYLDDDINRLILKVEREMDEITWYNNLH